MNIIAKIKFGSHLYGTNTENSDLDYKGIYLPTIDDLILQKANLNSISFNTKNSGSGTKNTKDDIDCEFYSLQYFIKLALQGETVCIDMLHVNDANVIETSPIFEFLRKNRHMFYTKQLKSFLGYCKSQAAKYSIKGSKLNTLEQIITILKSKKDNVLIGETTELEQLLGQEGISKETDIQGIQLFNICGKKIQYTSNVKKALECIEKYYNNYGARAILAKENNGIDWKAISHAFRAGYQLKSIYLTGDLTFPLKDAEFLKSIKQGNFHFVNDSIGEQLSDLINEVDTLAQQSNYPDSCDINYWQNFILKNYIDI